MLFKQWLDDITAVSTSSAFSGYVFKFANIVKKFGYVCWVLVN